MTEYRKAIVAGVIAVLIVLIQAIQAASADGGIDSQDWLTIALAVLGAVAVYFVPNTPTQ